MVVVFNGKLLRQPDDPGVEPIEARPFSARLILLCALAGLSPVAVLGAFLWWAI